MRRGARDEGNWAAKVDRLHVDDPRGYGYNVEGMRVAEALELVHEADRRPVLAASSGVTRLMYVQVGAFSQRRAAHRAIKTR